MITKLSLTTLRLAVLFSDLEQVVISSNRIWLRLRNDCVR